VVGDFISIDFFIILEEPLDKEQPFRPPS